MNLAKLDESAKAQHESLCKIIEALDRLSLRSGLIHDSRLASLGIAKAAPLDIDKQIPCDWEPRFFKPSYQDEHLTHALGADDPEYVTSLVETGLNNAGTWGENFDRSDPDDSEWMEPTPDQLPAFRMWWFAGCLDEMLQLDLDNKMWWEDEEEHQQHESRTDGWRIALNLRTGGSTFRMPRREDLDWDYRCLSLLQPRDPAKPHLAVIMGDSKVPRKPEEEMLVSELHAAVEFSKRQLTCGDFTNHHTKPIIIHTLMSETHARITQAHFDHQTNKLVVRQSRILDLRGKKPTPDAYLLLRWMMSTPVGETQDEGHGDKQ